MSDEPIYFADGEAFRRWLEANASTAVELAVGFVKRGTKTAGLTWPQAVDEALCFGWIDGVRRRVDAERYQIRFTPRKAGSTWSAVNIDRFTALQAEGRVTPAGVAAFEQRTERKSRTYSYEQAESPEFSPSETKAFKQNKAAWAFFESLSPSYRRKVTWWVISPKLAATRKKRFATFLKACSEGRKL
jgi:uncharacterized protein YdeI (YjbR/CyaY-like superfamily)